MLCPFFILDVQKAFFVPSLLSNFWNKTVLYKMTIYQRFSQKNSFNSEFAYEFFKIFLRFSLPLLIRDLTVPTSRFRIRAISP